MDHWSSIVHTWENNPNSDMIYFPSSTQVEVRSFQSHEFHSFPSHVYDVPEVCNNAPVTDGGMVFSNIQLNEDFQ